MRLRWNDFMTFQACNVRSLNKCSQTMFLLSYAPEAPGKRLFMTFFSMNNETNGLVHAFRYFFSSTFKQGFKFLIIASRRMIRITSRKIQIIQLILS